MLFLFSFSIVALSKGGTEVDPGSWERGGARALHMVNFNDVFQIKKIHSLLLLCVRFAVNFKDFFQISVAHVTPGSAPEK
jgi:hypothetical protein